MQEELPMLLGRACHGQTLPEQACERHRNIDCSAGFCLRTTDTAAL